MTKTIYITYDELTNGKYFEELQAPEDFYVIYPFVEQIVPQELKLPKYDWSQFTWVEGTVEAAKKEAEEAKRKAEQFLREKEAAEQERQRAEAAKAQAEAAKAQAEADLELAQERQVQLEQEKEQTSNAALRLTRILGQTQEFVAKNTDRLTDDEALVIQPLLPHWNAQMGELEKGEIVIGVDLPAPYRVLETHEASQDSIPDKDTEKFAKIRE